MTMLDYRTLLQSAGFQHKAGFSPVEAGGWAGLGAASFAHQLVQMEVRNCAAVLFSLAV